MASLQKTTLTIPTAGTVSGELESSALRNCRALSFQAPSALTGTVTVQAGDLDSAGGVFTAVQSPPGTDITLAASKTSVMLATPFPRLRLSSSVAEAADRVFVVWLQIGE